MSLPQVPGPKGLLESMARKATRGLRVRKEIRVFKVLRGLTVRRVLMVSLIFLSLLELTVPMVRLVRLVLTARRAIRDLQELPAPRDPKAIKEFLERKGYRVRLA